MYGDTVGVPLSGFELARVLRLRGIDIVVATGTYLEQRLARHILRHHYRRAACRTVGSNLSVRLVRGCHGALGEAGFCIAVNLDGNGLPFRIGHAVPFNERIFHLRHLVLEEEGGRLLVTAFPLGIEEVENGVALRLVGDIDVGLCLVRIPRLNGSRGGGSPVEGLVLSGGIQGCSIATNNVSGYLVLPLADADSVPVRPSLLATGAGL